MKTSSTIRFISAFAILLVVAVACVSFAQNSSPQAVAAPADEVAVVTTQASCDGQCAGACDGTCPGCCCSAGKTNANKQSAPVIAKAGCSCPNCAEPCPNGCGCSSRVVN